MQDLKSIAISDLNYIFDELAEAIVYEQDGQQYQIKAVISEQSLEEEEERLAIESKVKVYIRDSELSSLGIKPQIHDLIAGQWEVEGRKLNAGLWELSCYSSIRPRP